MSDAFARGRLGGFSFQAGEGKNLIADRLAWVTPAPVLTPGSPPAPATPALVAHAQGGLTLGPERGELAADFWFLGRIKTSEAEGSSSTNDSSIFGELPTFFASSSFPF
jgi:hypothetical protein